MAKVNYETDKLSYEDWVSLHHDAILPQELDRLNLYKVTNSLGSRAMTLSTFEKHWIRALEGQTISVKPATVPLCLVISLLLFLFILIIFIIASSVVSVAYAL